MLIEIAIVQRLARHDEGQQLVVFSRPATGTDMHLRHLRVLQNTLLDLAGLDAKTADLHLTINPPCVLDQPVGIDPHLIAGSVMQHVPGIGCRQAQETLCGLCTTVTVTACDPLPLR